VKNNEEAFNKIVKDNHTSIYRICMAYLYDKSHADDLYQEILIQVWKSLNSYKGDAQLSTWVYRVAINTALNYNIKNKKHVTFSLREVIIIEGNESDKENKEKELDKLFYCIQQLEAQDRLIISLVLEDKSYKEIAEIVGSNINHIGVKISRIKARLFKLMENTSENGL